MKVLVHGSFVDGFTIEGPFGDSISASNAVHLEMSSLEGHEKLLDWVANLDEQQAELVYIHLIEAGLICDETFYITFKEEEEKEKGK